MQNFILSLLIGSTFTLVACERFTERDIDSTSTFSVASSSTSSLEQFHKTESGDFIGALFLKGYPVREKHCDDEMASLGPCQNEVTYVFLKITDGITPSLKEFLEQNEGNAFVGPNSVGLGCEESKDFAKNLSLIDLGNAKDPVILVLNRPYETPGMGVRACYSHFEIVSVSQ